MKMHWDQLLLSHRFAEPLGESVDVGRSHYHKDYDRIVFSSAFRRLERKTQVHPLSENDHIHSRLTHSLEVSCVGRSLGALAGAMLKDRLPEWTTPEDIGAIVQAACLAHDIGNPPFGHTGEDAIRQWFRDPANHHFLEGLTEEQRLDLQTFEGNAQGFRIVTQIEHHRFDGGMKLTYATLGAFLKYPWTVERANQVPEKGEKFGVYQSELPIVKEVAENLGLLEISPNHWCRHPLVYLMEAADDICYAIIDLEDGVEMGLISYDEMEALILPVFGDEIPPGYLALSKREPPRRRIGMLRGLAIDRLVRQVSQVFCDNEQKMLAGEDIGDLINLCDQTAKECILGAKQLAREKIFRESSKNVIEIGAYTTIANILEVFIGAAQELIDQGQCTFRNKKIMDLLGTSAPDPSWNKYQAYQRMVDYLAGMTDRFAVELAQNFRGLRVASL